MATKAPKRKERAYSPTETQDFAGVIVEDNGRKRLQISSQQWYQHQLNKFSTGERVSLYISSFKPKRTTQQNRWYWAYLTEIAHETGNEIEELHNFFKGKFLSKGIVEVFGEKVRKTKSTTNLSKDDFSTYIENIKTLTGIEPPPTRNYLQD